MRRLFAGLMVLILLPAALPAANVTVFEDGSGEGVAELETPGCCDELNITLPADCHIRKATLNVSNLQSGAGCPEAPSVRLGETVLWEFNWSGFGALGMQDSFSGGVSEWRSGLGVDGGENSTCIRLPKRAEVGNATLGLECDGPGGFVELANITGDKPYDLFGVSATIAGDVNGDGHDDIIVGAPENNVYTGAAYIYFGGPELDIKEDVVLTGEATMNHFAFSVSGAGDVNNDGFDDVVVGAPYHSDIEQWSGRAYLFLGGANMDSIADVVFEGESAYDSLGYSVSGAGDVNNDGFDDVIVGVPKNDSKGADAGCAHLYLGGANMDGDADLTFNGAAEGDFFGVSVSGAGDMNNDGYADAVVGASGNDFNGYDTGAVYLYLGGRILDDWPDLNFTGLSLGGQFGSSVSDAGDVNADGYGDLIVGALMGSAEKLYSGCAYIFLGGGKVDPVVDLALSGEASYDCFGASVSGAGDVDGDGCDDVIVGAPMNGAAAYRAGRAYMFFCGDDLDSEADLVFSGEAEDDRFGIAVSGAGDFRSGGNDEIIVGAQFADFDEGVNNGKLYLFGKVPGIMDPGVEVGDAVVWNASSYSNLTNTTDDFAQMLNDYLSNAVPSGIDGFRNDFVDVPVRVVANGMGNITLRRLNITYEYSAAVPDFSDELNDYLAAHRGERDECGNITVPFRVLSRTPGRLKLFDLKVVVDEAPRLVRGISGFRMPEDSVREEAVDLFEHFEDDYDIDARLRFEVVSVTNGTIVGVEIVGNRFLCVDALEGEANDNWTGTLDIVLSASDTHGSTTESNPFTVRITNVGDPPVITSAPILDAVRGEQYTYNMTAVDGDGDPLHFYLEAGPEGMTVDSEGGRVNWTPPGRGSYAVSLFVTDGPFRSYQNYSISVPNSPPRMEGDEVPGALLGVPYTYAVPALDDDGDPLQFTLLTEIVGMELDSSTGVLNWTPNQLGDIAVSVRISDGEETIKHDFVIRVMRPNRAPTIEGAPAESGIVGLKYKYDPQAEDADGDPLVYALVEGPPGMVVDNSTGLVSWTPGAPGNYSVKLMVSDGRGGEAVREFAVRIGERVRAAIEIDTPAEGETVGGKVTVSGWCVRGSLDVVAVQLRVDSGEWTNASGNLTWHFMLDTARLGNGRHTIHVRAYDGMDYSDVVSRTLTVDNPSGTELLLIAGPVAGLLVAAAAIAAAAMMIRRKKRRGDTGSRPTE